jgi:WD40 repeat protein
MQPFGKRIRSIRSVLEERREILVELQGHGDYAIRPKFSPDGTLLATVGWDGVVMLWGIPGE